MKIFLISLLGLLSAIPAQAQEIVLAASDIARTLALEMKQQSKTSVAVSSFRDAKGEATRVGGFLAEEIANQLVAFAGSEIKVVERTRADAIFDEQRKGIEGLREAGRLDAFVKILAVDTLVVGTISKLAELGDRARINARLIAVPTGDMLASASAFARVEDVAQEKLPGQDSLPRTSKQPSRDNWKTVDFEVINCQRQDRDLVCELLVTNTDRDREVTFNFKNSFVYDQLGRRYQASRGKIANVEDDSSASMRLVSEVPTLMKVYFEDLPSGIEVVKVLHLKLYSSGWSYGDAELRNIVVEQ